MNIKEMYDEVHYQLKAMCEVPVQNRTILWQMDFERLCKTERKLKDLLDKGREKE